MTEARNGKLNAVQKISLFSNIQTQLRTQHCISVKGNPVSIVPNSVIEICYSLGWKVKSLESSLTDPVMATYPTEKAEMNIDFASPVSKSGTALQMVWTLNPTQDQYSVQCNTNGSNEKQISFTNEDEKVQKSGQLLKQWIQELIK